MTRNGALETHPTFCYVLHAHVSVGHGTALWELLVFGGFRLPRRFAPRNDRKNGGSAFGGLRNTGPATKVIGIRRVEILRCAQNDGWGVEFSPLGPSGLRFA